MLYRCIYAILLDLIFVEYGIITLVFHVDTFAKKINTGPNPEFAHLFQLSLRSFCIQGK